MTLPPASQVTPRPRILVVDDDRVTVDLLEEILRGDGYEVEKALAAEEGLEKALKRPFDVVVSDIRMVEMDGLALLRNLRRECPKTVVILITAFGSLESTVEAIRDGAFDYLSKPFRIDEVVRSVRGALEHRQVLENPADPSAAPAKAAAPRVMVGSSRAMANVYKIVARIAGGTSTVLIRGETGTGKRLVARAIHDSGPRARGPFVSVNLPSLPETLLEAELFGHMKGAFTGATADRPGLVEAAAGGTLFLDEIGDSSPSLQTKLLKAVEEREIKRVGGTAVIRVNARILAATNRDLEKMIGEGTFRDDLFYRLNVVPILIPPLRERAEEVPELASHFVARFAEQEGKRVDGISDEAMGQLASYPWPGNVRELEHVIERAVALTTRHIIVPDDLPETLRADGPRMRPTLEEHEREYIRGVLIETKGNRIKAAAILGIDRKTLYRKIIKFGLEDSLPR